MTNPTSYFLSDRSDDLINAEMTSQQIANVVEQYLDRTLRSDMGDRIEVIVSASPLVEQIANHNEVEYYFSGSWELVIKRFDERPISSTLERQLTFHLLDLEELCESEIEVTLSISSIS